jgi:hypothetical protein
MTSKLSSRIARLEQQAKHSGGCPLCKGRAYHILETGAPWPDWLVGQFCRGCGNGIKIYDRETWDLVP